MDENPLFNPTYEEKIAYDHLVDMHARQLSHVDQLDSKIAQFTALNGIILSFVFSQLNLASKPWVFSIGLSLIIISMLFGCYAYSGKIFKDGVKRKFFDDMINFKAGDTYKKLKNQLLNDIEHNTNVQNVKASNFNIMIKFNIAGLIILIIGYYA